MATATLTPMMQQFYDLKAKHPDALLLFRCGDFYETYAEDAQQASEILGITLTRRNNGKEGAAETLMAGFPYHALDTYLPKLVRAGRRVAICDQLEDPKLTKKLVKRGITELVTPGVTMSDTVLQGKENNFLAAVFFGKAVTGISLLDISTGEFLVAEGPQDYVRKLMENFSPKEILYEHGKRQMLENTFGTGLTIFELDDWVFTDKTAHDKLCKHFRVKNMKGYGIDYMKNAMVAAGAILHYLELTQHTQIKHITNIQRIEADRYVRLDKFTIHSLELIQPMSEGGRSLMDVLDHTLTPMGGRLLHRWLLFPLKDPRQIDERLDVVEEFFRNVELRDTLSGEMQEIGDLERIVAKINTARVTPRELLQLASALTSTAKIKEACCYTDNGTLISTAEKLHPLDEVCQLIRSTIKADAPLQVQKGGVIRQGISEELDKLRDIAYHGKEYLLNMQQREIERTGIQSLKIGYNNVFGYYLEVRNTFKDKVPEEWIRKQTLVSAERYITEELKQYEEKITGAEEKILALETQLYATLIEQLISYTAEIQSNANLLAHLDCLLSFATVARENRYIRPVIDDSLVLDIKQGRHPVIETQMPVGERYIANDTFLDNNRQQIIIVTGPNMAGKSALLRQTALITLMAQIGCFVPAESARIGYVDKIFTRVGASDNISAGESTFMVEMSEASNILNNLSPRSLVLFDELGRGTSTYDGISIAWSIVEYIHENPRAHARTLFATHYHELNEMEKTFQRIRNYNVSVHEKDGQVIFLRKLTEGGSEHSFGIHVARLAGMPQGIVRRAEVILKQLEENMDHENLGKGIAAAPESGNGVQMSFFKLDDPILTQIRDELIGLDINNLTPLEALNKLSSIQKLLK